MPAFEEISKKFKKIILIVIAALLAALGYFAYDVKPDTKAVLDGDISTIGQSLEDAPIE